MLKAIAGYLGVVALVSYGAMHQPSPPALPEVSRPSADKSSDTVRDLNCEFRKAPTCKQLHKVQRI